MLKNKPSRPTFNVSSQKSDQELTSAVLDWLHSKGYNDAYNALKQQVGEVLQESPLIAGSLERRWNTVLRLQRQLTEAQAKIQQLEKDAALSSSNIVSTEVSLKEKFSWIAQKGINALAYAPGQGLIFSASDDSTIKAWDVEDGNLEKTLKSHLSPVYSLLYHDETLYSGSGDCTIKVWKDFSCTQTLYGHEDSVLALAYSTHGLLSSSKDGEVRLWHNGHCIQSWQHHAGPVKTLDVSRDDNWFVTGSSDNSLTIWSFKHGIETDGLCHDNVVETVAFAPSTANIYVRRLKAGILGATPPATPTQSEESLAPSFLASGGRDKIIQIWDMNGDLVASLEGHGSWIRQIQFHPAGRHLLSVSDDKTFRLWDLKTGRSIRIIPDAHSSFITSLIIAPSGKLAWTAGLDGTIKAWTL